MTEVYWNTVRSGIYEYELYDITISLLDAVWSEFLKERIDKQSSKIDDRLNQVAAKFFALPWFRVYDLLEFLAEHGYADEFPERCNEALRREGAGYRFVGKQIVPITSEEEVAQIEQALETLPGAVATHLLTAVKFLADRQSPDYRNSIKESISAVEAMCNSFLPKPTSLGKALDQLDEHGVPIHPVLKAAFDKLFGYTSNAAGIRHALVGDEGVGEEEARFFLVACSAFVNYLGQKSGPTARV